MTKRSWLYNRMATFPGLLPLIGDGADPETARIFAKKSMTSAIEMHPYLVYKFGYNAAEELSDAEGFIDPERQFLQVWVHDYASQEIADYTKIDEVVKQLKLALHGQVVPDEGIFRVKYLETSQDLDDDTLNTVFRYVRFQMINEGEKP